MTAPFRLLLTLTALVSSLSLPAREKEPIVHFDFTAHSLHSTLRDLEVDLPGKGLTSFFVPNHGFGTFESYQGPINGVLKFYRKGAPMDAPPALSLPVKKSWQNCVVFLVSNYKSREPDSLQIFPVPLERSQVKAGSVYFCNFTQSKLAVKLGEKAVFCPPGKHRMIENASQNGALETVLVELNEQQNDFLYRNGLRVRNDEFIFLFVLPAPKKPETMTIQMIRYPVQEMPNLQTTQD